MTGNNPNLDLVDINAYTKFGRILSIYSKDIEQKLSICSQVIEQKQNQGP